MFNVGDVIMHERVGICEIEDIRDEAFANDTKKYYVLKQMNGERSVIYVPVNTDTSIIRSPMSAQEVDDIILNIDEAQWIDNQQRRKEHFRQVMHTGVSGSLAGVIVALRNHERTLEAANKKLHVADHKFLEMAESLLLSEFSYVLGEDGDIILSRMMETSRLSDEEAAV